MSRRATAGFLAAMIFGGLSALHATPARATDVAIPAGTELTMTADIVLTGDDTLTMGDPNGPRCKIHGAGHSINNNDQPWNGTLTISNCDFDGMGTVGGTAINLSGSVVNVSGPRSITIQGSTFSTSAEISMLLGPTTDAIFRNNTIADDSIVVNVHESLTQSQPSFYAKGMSTGTHLFQGNRVRFSLAHFDQTNNWLIGGDTPADGNILAGPRTGILIERSGPMTIRGNYSSTLGRGWNQVKNITVYSPGGGPVIIEHNVLIGMSWNTEVDAPGEIRYNLIVNPVERAWVQIRGPAGTLVHHNLLVQTSDSQSDDIAGGFVVFPGDYPATTPSTSQIYNNTFDAGGACNPGLAGAVNTAGTVLASLRSNAFVNIRLPHWTSVALINQGDGARTVPDPLPTTLGYADYNLFNNTDPSVKANYGVGVAGKTIRIDAGFGLHDVPSGGAMNAQTAPGFVGKMPHSFPFAEADVIAGKTNICQILAFYRQAYTPGAGSPLIDAGDPQDGPGNDIGAIGAGAEDALDQFGRFCPPESITPLVPDPAIFNCPPVQLEAGGGGGAGGDTGGGLVVDTNHKFACVCQASDARGRAPLLETIALAVFIAGALRWRPRASRSSAARAPLPPSSH